MNECFCHQHHSVAAFSLVLVLVSKPKCLGLVTVSILSGLGLGLGLGLDYHTTWCWFGGVAEEKWIKNSRQSDRQEATIAAKEHKSSIIQEDLFPQIPAASLFSVHILSQAL